MPKRISIMLVATLLAGLATAGPVSAERERWTRGDAEAMLHTYPLTDNTFERLDEAIGLDIRPFPDFYAATPYCVEDWHVVALAFWDAEFVALGGQIVYTRDDAWNFLTSLEAEFLLDGTPIAIETAPIRPTNTLYARESSRAYLESLFGANFELGTIWGVQWGQVMAPDELAVGNHTLQVIVMYRPGTPDEFTLFDDQTPFTVYPADSAACTGG